MTSPGDPTVGEDSAAVYFGKFASDFIAIEEWVQVTEKNGYRNPNAWIDEGCFTKPAIVVQPLNQSAMQGDSAVFSLAVSSCGTLVYKWYKNNVLVDSSNRSTFIFRSISIADNNTMVKCQVSNEIGIVMSNNAILTVMADTIPPSLRHTEASGNPKEVLVSFSEPLGTGAALPGHYSINNGVTISAVSIQQGLSTIKLTTSNLLPNVNYTLAVSNVTDLSDRPNTIVPNPSTDTFLYQNGLPNHDFETGDLTDWIIIQGTAFSQKSVTNVSSSSLTGEMFNQHGQYHLSSNVVGHDSATGVLQSLSFTVGGDGSIDFLISGGNDPGNLYIALIASSSQQVLFKATGNDSDQFRKIVWNAQGNIGTACEIRIVDNSRAGHINVDDINVSIQKISDIQIPVPPSNLTAKNLTATSVLLTWSPSHSNGIKDYFVYRNGAVMDTVSDTFFVENTLIPQTKYSFQIRSIDSLNNLSPGSDTLAIVTPKQPVKIESPKAKDTLYVGDSMRTVWVVDRLQITGLLFSISLNSGKSWELISTAGAIIPVSDTGVFVWQIPLTSPTLHDTMISDNILLKASDYNQVSIKDVVGPFSIQKRNISNKSDLLSKKYSYPVITKTTRGMKIQFPFSGNFFVDIFSIAGTLIQHHAIHGRSMFVIHSLPAGSYLIKIKAEKNTWIKRCICYN